MMIGSVNPLPGEFDTPFEGCYNEPKCKIMNIVYYLISPVRGLAPWAVGKEG